MNKLKVQASSWLAFGVILSIILIVIMSSTNEIKQNQITGYVASSGPVLPQEEQKQLVCQIANSYNMPGAVLLTIAEKETGINHWLNGQVKISSDGGVGIMQIDRGTGSETIAKGCADNGGISKIDNRKLDLREVADNIECGALHLLGKCSSLGCQSASTKKEYHCPNTEFPNLAEKRVFYSGWDIALRAYNGWGCGSEYYKARLSPAAYEALVRRIQNYVEDFHSAETKHLTYCGDEGYNPGSFAGTYLEPPEIPEGAIGIYAVTPSFETKVHYSFNDYEWIVENVKEVHRDVYLTRQEKFAEFVQLYCDGEIVLKPETIMPAMQISVEDSLTKLGLGWSIVDYEDTMVVLGVASDTKLPLFSNWDDLTMDRYVVYYFAINFTEINMGYMCAKKKDPMEDPEKDKPENCGEICSPWINAGCCSSMTEKQQIRSCEVGSSCPLAQCESCGAGLFICQEGQCGGL